MCARERARARACAWQGKGRGGSSLAFSAAALLALSSFHAVASASCRTGAVVGLGGVGRRERAGGFSGPGALPVRK